MRDKAEGLAADLLEWYDIHAREMPWRVPPHQKQAGIRPDPYRVWLSEVMLQQTTVAAVIGYFNTFTARWPTVAALADAQDADVMGAWAGLGYYARARNLLKCARQVRDDFDGVFPQSRDALLTLPGIGPYTAAAVAAIAYDERAVVVDGNVERVMARLHNIHTPLPTAKPELTQRADDLTPDQRAGDYAQAVMDLGATICTPRNPACGICPWQHPCKARREGVAAGLPKKLPKQPKPVRHGHAYLAQRHDDSAWLLETRPDKGLLGGMLGWPGGAWGEKAQETPPVEAEWVALGEVRHTFTHFHLILRVHYAQVTADHTPMVGSFVPAARFDPTDLPTVMRKAFDLVQGARSGA